MYRQSEPDYSTTSDLLTHLNSDELKKLLNDDVSLNGMLKDVPHVRNLETDKEMLLTGNKSIAEFNLSKEPQLREAKMRLAETYEKAVEVFGEAENNKQKLEEFSKQNALDTTLAILQAAAAQSEEDSETIAEKFMDGGLDVETFLDEFQSKRKIAHLRRIKSDKLNELLNAANQSWNPPGIYGNHLPMRNPPVSYGHRQ